MNGQLLSLTKRTERLVNRAEPLDQIRGAIFDAPYENCQVVFIYGKGGMGKSRLTEEVLWLGGNWRSREKRGAPDASRDWARIYSGTAIFPDLIDVTATHLHASASFMHALRDALVSQGGEIEFNRYDSEFAQYRRLRQQGGEYAVVQQAARRAEQAFLDDYRCNAEKQRLVITLDTVEKLFPLASRWLIDKGLIHTADLEFYTIQWLADQIQNGNLPNTTLLLVGRGEEGKDFFELMRNAFEQSPAAHLLEIKLSPFNLDDSADYLKALIEDLQKSGTENSESHRIIDDLKFVLEQDERVKVLWLYTGGQPVRLSLYTDIIIEGFKIPEPLQDRWSQAVQRVKTKDPIGNETQELHDAQWEIEGEFITLLFSGRDLRSEILQALVRTPRGLDAEQIYFALFKSAEADPDQWKKNPKMLDQLQQIEAQLENLRGLAIVKMRPDGRFGLQDEIYRIYSDHLSQTEDDCQDEIKARRKLYERLTAWAEHQLVKKDKERDEFQREDERSLRLASPASALSVQFPPLGEIEEEHRAEVREAILQWELERLHYVLLLDLRNNVNDAYFDLAEERWQANDEAAEAMAQAELWQVLRDEYALKFAHVEAWKALKERNGDPIVALRRVAEQDEAARWIKRFVLRKGEDYHRALEFARALEKTIDDMPEGDIRDSWQHTFARGERIGWAAYARILLNQNIEQAIKQLDGVLDDLTQLASHSEDEIVFPERGRQGERGFQGHPGEPKLHRVIAMLYTFVGYGYAMQGKTQKALDRNGKALKYMRATEFPARHATLRNNLSRVLSDMGRVHARQVCSDALYLRRQIGAEVPIAYSLNTLALIDNDFLRPDSAWEEAAMAMAYFRRAEEPRGLGLAFIQLAEALRRLAMGERKGWTLPMPAEALYTEAENALRQAIDLFKEGGPAGGEVARWVEAQIEMGCLQRDWILISEGQRKERRYREALSTLQQAARKATEIQNTRLQMDAEVNLAWVHYYFGKFDAAEDAIFRAEKFIPPDAFLTTTNLPAPGRDDVYVYHQLSKISALHGRIALERFRYCADEVGSGISDKFERRRLVKNDQGANDFLRTGAEQYSLAIAYASIFSPRSSVLSVAYDSLYDYLKKFNEDELEQFYKYEREARKKYNLGNLGIDDVSKVDQFLNECFGAFHE